MHRLRTEIDVDVDIGESVGLRHKNDPERQQEFQNGTHAPPLPFESPLRRARMAHPKRHKTWSRNNRATANGGSDESRLGIAPLRSVRTDRAKSWRRMGDVATVILDVLGVPSSFEREAVRKQDETGLAVEVRADRGKAIGPHVCFRALDAVSEQAEGRGVSEIGDSSRRAK